MIAKYRGRDLRFVSICLDEKKEDAEKALRRTVGQDPVLSKLTSLGIELNAEAGNPREVLLKTLRGAGVRIDGRAAEGAVVESLAALGLDLEQLNVLGQDPFPAAFGKESAMHMVPRALRDLYLRALHCSGPPQVYVIDQRGILRMHGYPFEEEVAELLSALLREGT